MSPRLNLPLPPAPETTRRLLAAVLAATCIAGLAACSAASENADKATSGGSAAAHSADLAGTAGSGSLPERSGSDAHIVPTAVIDRQVISHAELTVRADDVGRALNAAEQAATGVGGFVADERTQADKNGSPQTSTLQLRVPSRSFDDVLGELSKLGRLESSYRSSEDVTGQVIDVNSRVRSARDALDRIRLLLGRAEHLGDVIRLESELSSRESDLESLEARQAYFADQTSLATISLTLLSPETTATKKAADTDGFLAGLSSGWHALSAAATALATVSGAVLPFVTLLILVGLPIALVARASRRRRTPAPSPTPPTADA